MKNKKTLAMTLAGGLSFISTPVGAHCPLCTAGAGAMAGAAALLGVRYGAIGIFLGAFATAMGLWLSARVKRQYIPYQKQLLFLAIYLSTLLPLIPLTRDYSSVMVPWFGDYGTLFNRTYLINWFVVGALIGTLIVWYSPALSQLLTRVRGGRKIKFQGLLLTLVLLLISGVLMQILL